MSNQQATIHKTSTIVPADYRVGFGFATPENDMPNGMNWSLLLACKSGKPVTEFIYGDLGGLPVVVGSRMVQPVARLNNWASDRTCQCDVCGAHFKYGEVWTHIPTNESIVIGHECAEKFGLLTDRKELDAYRKDAAQARKMGRNRLERKKALRAFVKDASDELLAALKVNHEITKSIRSKMIRWAAKSDRPLMSEKQIALVLRLAEQAAAPKEAEEVKIPAPISDKRQVITGTIVSVKGSETCYGYVTRMTVKVTTDEGVWLCNGTLPSLANFERGNDFYGKLRGCVIEFSALMATAGSDSHFAFFKRPTKASIIQGGESQKEQLAEITDVLSRDTADNFGPSHLKHLQSIKKNLEGMLAV
jgi:hypothetical protein